MVNDYSRNRYRDKVETPIINGKITFLYKFEGGDMYTLNIRTLIYTHDDKKITYTLNFELTMKFKQLQDFIVDEINNGKVSNRYNNNNNNNNPIIKKYQKLKDKIKLREEQLYNMGKDDPNRESLENELDNYKRIMERIKKDNKFEHLVCFKYFKINE